MSALVRPTPLGRARVLGRDASTREAGLALLLEAARAGQRAERPVELAGEPAWLKGAPLRGAAAWRYGLRRRLLRVEPPRAREHGNLVWLRARLFRAPEPLAAATLERGGRAVFQLLVTARIAHEGTLEALLPAAAGDVRRAWLDELASEVARMHALRFVHRDLHARNVLVTPASDTGDPRRLVFVDAWRGGPGPGLRGASYDLGCWMLAGAGLLDEAESRRFFARYFGERRVQQRPARPEPLLRAAARTRERLLRQLAREPHRWRSPTPPAATWDWRRALGG